jgi:hypothetical protein
VAQGVEDPFTLAQNHLNGGPGPEGIISPSPNVSPPPYYGSGGLGGLGVFGAGGGFGGAGFGGSAGGCGCTCSPGSGPSFAGNGGASASSSSPGGFDPNELIGQRHFSVART